MNWFYNLKIQSKLIVSFGIVVLLLVVLGLSALYQLNNVNNKTKEISYNWMPSCMAVEKLTSDISFVRRMELQHILSQTLQEMDSYEQRMSVTLGEISKNRAIYEPLISSDDERNLYNEFSNEWNKYIELDKSLIALSRQNKTDEARSLIRGESKAAYDKATAALEKLVTVNQKGASAASKAADDTYASSKTMISGVIALSIILAMLLAVFIARLISKRVNQILDRFGKLEKESLANLEHGALKMSEGELEFSVTSNVEPLEITSKDEIGQLAASVNQIINKTGVTASALETAASTVRQMVGETQALVHSALEGKLSLRGNAGKFKGGYREVIDGLNQTMDAVVTPIHQSTKILEIVSKGDLTARMEGEYSGDFKLIKDSINMLTDSMGNALLEVNEAVQATASAANEISS
ncbi:MAG: HAMP domain-containing protein, partial [Ignavibacteria bacterium]|nr:HAMP domain-containing protein [Ignavibacteria bacterium]MCU7518396.1 HAMP domain-containing protein [Ignavibacteria bacterium]